MCAHKKWKTVKKLDSGDVIKECVECKIKRRFTKKAR